MSGKEAVVIHLVVSVTHTPTPTPDRMVLYFLRMKVNIDMCTKLYTFVLVYVFMCV